MPRIPAFAVLNVGLVLTLACGSDEENTPTDLQTGTFVIEGSASAAPPFLLGNAGSAARTVDPSLFKVGFYRLYLGSTPDCTFPSLLRDYGTRTDFDLLTGPTLFRVTGVPMGVYPCLIMRLSDVLEFVPASDFGPCVAGTTYHTDTYRAGETDFKDVGGATITGTGSDASPMDDKVDVFFTINPAAVIGRGFSVNQVLPLGGPAIVPGTSTFYFDGSGAVTDEGGTCRMVPGSPPEFR